MLTFATDAVRGLADASAVSLQLNRDAPVTVALRRPAAVVAALKTCQDDLLRTWGIDPGEGDRIATPAKAATAIAPADWISANEYPSEALSERASGEVVILWTIGLDRRAQECRIVSSSGNAALDSAACAAITTNARYASPALDAAGTPIVSHATRHIIWRVSGG